MNIALAIDRFLEYEKEMSVQHTVENYQSILYPLKKTHGDSEIDHLTPEVVFSFLSKRTEKCNKTTKHMRFTQLKAFFNFCISGLGVDIDNPCKSILFTKAFKEPRLIQRLTISKEVVDELIFRTTKLRNRILLELQARSGLRIGEVLKLKPQNIEGRKITLDAPRSGNETEVAYMPQGVSDRISTYINQNGIEPNEKIFPFTYSCAREIVKQAGKMVGIHLKAHDLRRHAATYASRCGVPLEVISKVILRHQDLKTSQIYLGKVSDEEAVHWMDTLHSR
jgi:site-specific recombinase XerD